MIPWSDPIAEYRALPPSVKALFKASLVVVAVSMAFLVPNYAGEAIGGAAYYLFNS